MTYIRPWLIAAILTASSPALADTGVASYYGWREHGRVMADGHRFHALSTSAASRTLAFGTRLRVTNLANGRHAVVVVEDRGPYVRGRMIDVSLGTARVLGMERAGVARVRVERVGKKH